MHHPFIEIPRRRRLPLFSIFLVMTLLTMFALNATGRPLISNTAPSGIISYEFAGDVATARAIIDSWDDSARIYAGFNIGLDYLYLLLYSTTIAMALLWSSDGLWIRHAMTLTVILAWGQWLAAALDIVENYGLFTMLVNAPADPWPQVVWLCAAVKFGLVIAGLLLLLVIMIIQILRGVRQVNK